MSGLERLIAVAMLAAPPGTPEPPIDADQWPKMQSALQQVAIELEILDPRETRYVFAHAESFENDLNLLRRRQQELRGAPMIWEADRFPGRTIVNDLLMFNRNFRDHLRARRVVETDRAELYESASRETERLYEIYDSVRDAQCEFYYITVRRQALKKLRCQLGHENFDEGHLPPVVPTWQFQVMK